MDAVHRGDVPWSTTVRPSNRSSSFDGPVALPTPRGPVSRALIGVLSGDPRASVDLRQLRWTANPTEATTDDDLQLSLWLAYEQHYRGLAGVDDRWEWHPELLWARTSWEQQLLDGLRGRLAEHPGPGGRRTRRQVGRASRRCSTSWLRPTTGPSLSKFLMREADLAAVRGSSSSTGRSTTSRRPTRTPGPSPG